MADTPSEEPPSTGRVDESQLEPVTRDSRFIVRLILIVPVALMIVIAIGAWMRGAAANCGSSFVRPGANVIPNH
jgi:hypothetical protein